MTEEYRLLGLQGCLRRTSHDAGDSYKVQLVDVLRAAFIFPDFDDTCTNLLANVFHFDRIHFII